MRFLSVSMGNFCSIGEAHVDLANQRMVVVAGKNLDAEAASSNASGKSSLAVDSICWCLFGKTTKGGSANSVTPGGNGKGTFVTIKFEVGDDVYELSRYRKHPKFSNQIILLKAGEDISKATAADTEAQVLALIGCDFDTFLYTTILGQGMMFRFSQLTDQNRKEVLEGIAKTSVYEDCRIAVRKRANDHESRLSVAKQQPDRLLAFVERDKQALLSVAASKEATDALHASQVAAYEANVASCQSTLTAAQAALAATPRPEDATELLRVLAGAEAAAREQVQAAMSKRTTAQAMGKNAEAALNTLMSSVQGQACSFCGSALTEEHKAAEYDLRSQAVTHARDAIHDAVAAETEAQGRLHKISYEKELVERNYRAVASALQQAEYVVKAADTRLKDTVSRGVGATKVDFSAQIQTLQNNIASSEAALVAANAEVVSITAEKDLASRWVDGFQDLRVSAMDSLMSFLNDRLTHYCKILCGDDIQVSLSHTDKGKIDLAVTTSGGSYQSASGGEKDRIDICVAFSLLALARQCTQWTSNILVLDEIAVFVDDTGIDRLMKLVDTLLDEIETVFVISHNPAFSGFGDKVITVVKENGVSRIENE